MGFCTLRAEAHINGFRKKKKKKCTNRSNQPTLLIPIDQCAQQDSPKGPLEMADIASETALQHLKSLYPYGEITSSLDGVTLTELSSLSALPTNVDF